MGPGPEGRARVLVSFDPNWVNGWFLRLLAVPLVGLDGVEFRASWTGSTRIRTTPGTHRLSTYVRYVGTPWNLGTGEIELEIPAGAVVEVATANGMLNSAPFRPRVLGTDVELG